ncbi:MAG: extracellular solute-binding protein, partial [Candidatus Dormibacteraeota bacterium]|nr:extracellular solute-binding protein [Candidatus Dormibacteraeota bacterium]
VKPDRVQPITALWHEAGWDKVFPKGLKEMVSARGEIWAVPLDVHRGNAMWASTRALAAAGGKVPESINDLVTLLDRARGAGIVAPLALGSKGNWQISMLFENSLLAVAGADHHRRLFSGQVSFTEPKVKEALVSLKTILGYANRDHPTLDWDEAAKRLAAGAGAVTFMGDWVKSYFTSLNFVPGRDFAGLPAPGTRGLYLVACDSFAIPRKAADRANAQDWIRACGSVEGQAAFSVRKGSIPPRTDAPKSLFDPIGQQFIDDFRGGVLLRSAALGSASAPVFVAALNGEMGTFAQTGDVNATANNLQRFSAQYLKA